MFLKVRQQRGVGLVAAIFLLVIVSSIVVTLGNLTDVSVRGFGQDLNAQRAFYAAEGGVEIALHRLGFAGEACSGSLGSIDFSTLPSDDGLENCTVATSCNTVTVAGIETWRITSAAECGTGFDQAQRQVEVQARRL